LNSANAADVALKAGPVLAPGGWTGCYVGVNVGFAGSIDNFDLRPSGTYLAPAGVAGPPNVFGTGLLAGDQLAVSNAYRVRDSTATGGGQAGCNWQSGQWVLGGEADIQWTGLDTTVDAAYGAIASVSPGFVIAPHTEHVSSRLDWLSTVRGRVGFLLTPWALLYGTGGLAIGGVSSDTAVTFGTVATTAPLVLNVANHVGSFSTTQLGWVAGGGVELAIYTNWTVKFEYLFVDLGTYSYVSPLVAPAGVAPGYSWTTNVHERDQLFRFGANYKFGAPYIR
jgi:outer membrane immunogenic protein